MAVTRAQIAIRALKRLGKLAYQESAAAGPYTDALQVYDEYYAELDEHQIVDWTSSESVPNKYAYWVISVVAYRLANDLGVSGERYMRIKVDNDMAEAELRRLFVDYYTPTEIKVKNY